MTSNLLKCVKGKMKWDHLCQGILQWSREAIKKMDFMYILTAWIRNF